MTAQSPPPSSPRRPKAAIIAIGSELLQGQIVNRNAGTISGRLFALGIDVVSHHTVDDERADIERILRLTAEEADWLFVTGGLGPTSDDLTRDAVASWAGLPLEYDEASWKHVTDLFQKLQRTAPETNKQQCFFPKGARVLTNRAGTANAFTLVARDRRLWVLPGPPREIDALWDDHLAADLEALVRDEVSAEARMILKKWRTIGLGESHLAEIVSPLLEGQGLTVAYRAHAPYVELKIRFPAVRLEEKKKLIEAIDAALYPYVYERDEEDHAKTLGDILAGVKTLTIHDCATDGRLADILWPLFRDSGAPPTVSWVQSNERTASPKAYVEECLGLSDDVEVTLALAGFGENGEWAYGVRREERVEVDAQAAPYPARMHLGRNQTAIAMLAVKAFREFFRRDPSLRSG